MDKRKSAITAMMVLSVLAGTLMAGSAGGPVIWDNGMNCDEALTGRADDFIFAENQIVRDVHWIGAYGFPAEDGNFDWEITFYDDDGTGNHSGAVKANYYFSNAETSETYMGPSSSGNSIYFKYAVDLPTPVEFAANTKYWISINGIGVSPPTSFWAAHSDPILLHEAGSAGEFGKAYDMCFQLTGGKTEVPEAPALTPTGLIALVSLLSAIAAVAIVRKRH